MVLIQNILFGPHQQSLLGALFMKLEELHISGTGVKSLRPLRGMPLRSIALRATEVSDLSPLEDCPLEVVRLSGSSVREISPLINSPVESLWIAGLKIKDYVPLTRMPLKRLIVTASHLDPEAQAILRSLDQLEHLGEAGDPEDQSPDTFWERLENGEYDDRLRR